MAITINGITKKIQDLVGATPKEVPAEPPARVFTPQEKEQIEAIRCFFNSWCGPYHNGKQ